MTNRLSKAYPHRAPRLACTYFRVHLTLSRTSLRRGHGSRSLTQRASLSRFTLGLAASLRTSRRARSLTLSVSPTPASPERIHSPARLSSHLSELARHFCTSFISPPQLERAARACTAASTCTQKDSALAYHSCPLGSAAPPIVSALTAHACDVARKHTDARGRRCPAILPAYK